MIVMICVEQFSKMVQLLPLSESYVHTMADKFLSMVASQHRLLEYIMNNDDPHFCSHFWDDLMSLLNMKLIFSIASHPQTNRIAEVMNQKIK